MNCASNKKNLGFTRCNDLPKQFRGMITTPMNFKLTAEEAATKAAWQEAILASKNVRIYKWPSLVATENASTDATYEQTTLADVFVDPGKYAWRLSISKDLCMHKAMFTHSGGDQRVIFFDGQKIFLQEDEDGNVFGFETSLINVEKLIISDGSVSTKTPVYVVLANSYDVDLSAITLPASWYSSLLPLTDVDLDMVSASATTWVVDVAATCDGTELSGLVVADFVATKTDGTSQTITAAVENPNVPGRYTLTGTALVDGFLTLKSAATLSVPGYESPTPVAVDVTP